MRILFVCLGNICRSPMAHGVMQHMLSERGLAGDVTVDSCGMYGEPEGCPTHRGTSAIIKKRLGTPYSKPSRHWRKNDYRDFDLILAMDSSNLRDILSEVGSDSQQKIRLFREFDPQGTGDVPDPYYSGGFDKVYDIVSRTCVALTDRIQSRSL